MVIAGLRVAAGGREPTRVLRMVHEPQYLRFFQARFERL